MNPNSSHFRSIRFLSEHTRSSLFPIWEKDDEVTYYLYRGSYPPGIKTSLSEDIEFEIIDPTSDTIIGCSGLHAINWVSRSAELRILIGDKLYWGQGIGKKVVSELLLYAFDILNLNRVWLGVNSENEPAINLYVKMGFIREGILRQEFYKHGKYFDIVRMSVLKAEWTLTSEK